MLGSKLPFEFLERRDSTGGNIRQPALYTGKRLQFVHAIPQLLISGSILHDNSSLPVDGEDHRVAAATHPFYECASPALEVA
jgi:hypothetical protein